MADFLDFLLSSPAKSPLPLEITSTTTLEDIIAATIQPETTRSTTNQTTNSYTEQTIDTTTPDHGDKTSQSTTLTAADDEDDETLAAAILAEATAEEPETSTPTTHRSYSATSPATETRLADSLIGLLGSPPPEQPLSHNPVFSELHSLLKSELKQQTMPETLMKLLQKPKTSVFHREQQLQHQFTKLESYNPTEVHQLSSFFKYQAAVIETERYQSLHQLATKPHLRDSINTHYDEQLHKVIDRVEVSIGVLQQAADSQTSTTSNKSAIRPMSLKRRPVLSRTSITLMEEWYQRNINHPYPDTDTIQDIAQQGDIREEQVKKWFANKRSRSHNTHSRSTVYSRKMSTRVNRHAYYTPY